VWFSFTITNTWSISGPALAVGVPTGVVDVPTALTPGVVVVVDPGSVEVGLGVVAVEVGEVVAPGAAVEAWLLEPLPDDEPPQPAASPRRPART
jgi:hypothetical protein